MKNLHATQAACHYFVAAHSLVSDQVTGEKDQMSNDIPLYEKNDVNICEWRDVITQGRAISQTPSEGIFLVLKAIRVRGSSKPDLRNSTPSGSCCRKGWHWGRKAACGTSCIHEENGQDEVVVDRRQR